jgi:hypothetical protein
MKMIGIPKQKKNVSSYNFIFLSSTCALDEKKAVSWQFVKCKTPIFFKEHVNSEL